ncbi:hypothetical protein NliqN6_2505 [Naganishia liquefaciens]|uniref:Uncharacterized protein n=1 Tax=Naganishia liquefaciens TaxID=104408 RepID=A0A8H3TSI9_9TREE|nr:hypothetical protein NliqN6_2505 [Naganishia liquefaciens]
MDTSSGVPELIQEAYNAKGRLIWRKIMIGRRLGINSNNCLAKASSSAREGCSTLSGSFSEEDAMRDVAPIFDVTVAVKASAKQESFKRASHQQAFGTKTMVEAADQEEKAKNPKAIVSVGTRGGVSAASSALTAQPNVKKGGITQSVLKFLGKLEDATIKSNRMREKNILGSHYELIKICLISQGFLVAAFVLVAIVSVNVAALLFIVVLFASR